MVSDYLKRKSTELGMGKNCRIHLELCSLDRAAYVRANSVYLVYACYHVRISFRLVGPFKRRTADGVRRRSYRKKGL